jgi:hypothetical protein
LAAVVRLAAWGGGSDRSVQEQQESVAELIPAMLTAYIESDRVLARGRKFDRAIGSSFDMAGLVTVAEFARLAKLSRRQIDRLRA